MPPVAVKSLAFGNHLFTAGWQVAAAMSRRLDISSYAPCLNPVVQFNDDHVDLIDPRSRQPEDLTFTALEIKLQQIDFVDPIALDEPRNGKCREAERQRTTIFSFRTGLDGSGVSIFVPRETDV